MSTIKPTLKNWKAPEEITLPDFIIGGAMKSGTTTLHTILGKHPNVFIPRGEINFFDMDDILQHPDFNFYNKRKEEWLTQNINANPQKMWQWYTNKLKNNTDSLVGEDSTAYLSSGRAAERIALQEKNIKLIFILRHPTSRAFSQYHHMLRTGRVSYSFENVIRFSPNQVLERSLYKTQLEKYYKVIPKERIKIVLFEDLITNTENTIKEVCCFLDLDYSKLNPEDFNAHSNESKFPISYSLQRCKNKIFKRASNLNYIANLPNSPVENKKYTALLYKIINKLNRSIVPLVSKKKPSINLSTKEFLDTYFYNELTGIEELIGKKILKNWFPKHDI